MTKEVWCILPNYCFVVDAAALVPVVAAIAVALVVRVNVASVLLICILCCWVYENLRNDFCATTSIMRSVTCLRRCESDRWLLL